VRPKVLLDEDHPGRPRLRRDIERPGQARGRRWRVGMSVSGVIEDGMAQMSAKFKEMGSSFIWMRRR